MKPYLLFAGREYECMGGMAEYIGDFDSIEAAKAHHGAGDIQYGWIWAQIAEHGTMRIAQECWKGQWSDSKA